MRILSYRRGFACNSSSSHSVVFFDKASKPRKDKDANVDFGWDHFTLISTEAKRRYAFAQIHHAADAAARNRLQPAPPYAWGTQPGAAEFQAWSKKVDDLAFEMLRELGWKDDHVLEVDHQSRLSVPMTFNGNGLLKPFATKLIEFFERDGVGILGGNDNGDGPHPLHGRAQHELLRALARDTAVPIGRDDKTHFVLFDKRDGSKARITFDDDVKRVTPLRGLTPELVDVKLTDYCEMDCDYCYQGSTTKGRHAPMPQVESILKALAGNRVFEVAFGGGEPTSHPNFIEILKLTRSLGMVPNFTTRNAKFLAEHPELFSETDEARVGAVAFSVDTAHEMAEAVATLWSDREAVPRQPSVLFKLQWQVVHGAASTEELKRMVDSPHRMYRPILLLGWKTTGRGSSVAPLVCDWESAFIGPSTKAERDLDDPTIASFGGGLYIDAEFQRQFGNRLLELGAIPETLGGPEGTFSMYIDAVNGVLGPSSYCEKKLMRPFEPFPSKEFIREAWDMLSVDGGEKWANGGLL